MLLPKRGVPLVELFNGARVIPIGSWFEVPFHDMTTSEICTTNISPVEFRCI
jgi:hypothetical protein